MHSVRTQRRSSTQSYRGNDEAPNQRAIRLLAEYRPIAEQFPAARKSLEKFTALTADPAYGKLMSLLRRAAVELEVDEKSAKALALLGMASKQLDVPVVDLKALARIPAHLVAMGSWRPRSVNVDLVEPDDTARLGPETAFQKSLNKISDKILPDVKEIRVPGLTPLYKAASYAVPSIDAAGKVIATPFAEAAEIVREWSDQLADDVQAALRRIRQATSPSGLKIGELAKLHPIEQRMALKAGECLSGLALEAELFVQWARDPKSVSRPAGISAALKRWVSAGLSGLSSFLRATASSIRVATDAESWKTLAVHAQVGGGIERWWVSSRGGATLMFPTLEQVEREGEAVIKVVSRLNPIDTIVGGMTLSSRGGGVNFRAGPVGAKVSDFEHEVKAGIPGIIGVAVGEDYAYGPVVAFGISPSVNGLLGLVGFPVNIRVGGEVKFYHAAFAGLSKPTRKMAEGISIACDAAHHAVKKAGSVATRHELSELEDGWPLRQKWLLAKRLVVRARAAKDVAFERLHTLESVQPARFIEYIGRERAEILGRDVEKPAETHETIKGYLGFLTRKIELESDEIERMGRAAGRGEQVEKKRVVELTESLRRSTLAFEFIDNLLFTLLVEPRLEREILEARTQRPPHMDHGNAEQRFVASGEAS